MERVTIDVTVTRDFIDHREARHADAQSLFQLARDGVIEIAAASSGFVFDVYGDLADQIRAAFASERVSDTAQLAYPGVMIPGDNAFPGAYVEGFGKAWQAVIADWRTHEGRAPGDNDALHIETHVMEGRDVFLTDDRALLAACRRLHDEHGIAVNAMTPADFLAAHR